MADLNSSSYNAPAFPTAGVAELIANRPFKEQQMRAQQQEQLVSGLKDFGAGVQSLVARRQAMAQALAGAQMYGQTPEGKALLGTNQVAQGPRGTPVTQNQTASYNPMTGKAISNQSPVTQGTLATAFYGDKPSDLMNQLFERQKNAQQYGLDQRKQALAENIEPKKLALEQKIQTQLAGIKGQEIGVQTSGNIQNQISSLQQKKAELVKSLPTGWFAGIHNQAAEAAKQQMADIDAQIAHYQSQLAGGNKTPTGDAAHMSTEDLMNQYRQLVNLSKSQ